MQDRKRARQSGLTLVELLLTIASTALIGAAIAAMLTAVSYGTETGKDMRSLVVKNKIINARLTAAIRNSQMVLERGNDYIVLWINDDDESTLPNLGEIQYIEYDSANTRVRSYAADFSGLSEAQIAAVNDEYALDADFASSTAPDRGQGHFPAEVWLNDTAAWAVTVNNADEQLASLVSFQLTLSHEQMSDIVVGAAALRNGN